MKKDMKQAKNLANTGGSDLTDATIVEPVKKAITKPVKEKAKVPFESPAK